LKTLAVSSAALAAASAIEIVLPGRSLYHAGWWNVLLAALAVIAIASARTCLVKSAGALARGAIAAIAFGAALTGIATVASGLLAPDNHEVVGAPGQRVQVADLGGTLEFPLLRGAAARGAVLLQRPGHAALAIGAHARDVGSFLLSTVPREVVSVRARDTRGGALTITQPTGVAFLSPVLLMQQRQTIDGMQLPYDSFAVPAAHRIVKAVYFTPQQAASLRGTAGMAIPAVLFAVDDDEDRPIPHAIALALDGQTVAAGGLKLSAVALTYPSIEVVAVPALIGVVPGFCLIAGGLIAARARRKPAV
jgi:hypothetical protein